MPNAIPAQRYDPVAVSLHWFIAISIILMIPLGFFMHDLPIQIRFDGYAFHKSLGLTVLGLSIFRFIWRLLNPPPALPDSMSLADQIVAHVVHWVLYFLMLAMPLTGWLMVSASKKMPTVFFWLGEVPFIPMPEGIDGKATAMMFKEYHYWLAIGAIALVCGHVLAALQHHFIKKDSILLRMLPRCLWRNHA
jgi:cytochrome b561